MVTKSVATEAPKSRGNYGTMILPCDCKSAFQDKTYGKGQRVFNIGGGQGSAKYFCTVCGKQK
jgi:hypothetical protein